MAQLKKTRAQIDPTILRKIRSIIAGNPKIMKGLGVDKMPEEEKLEARPVKPLVEAGHKITQGVAEADGAEKIDQSKNMETMAKLMALKPSEIDNIKAVLLKTKD